MSTNLKTTVKCSTQFNYSNQVTGFNAPAINTTAEFSPDTYTNTQADVVYAVQVSIPPGSSQTWTLSAIPGSDPGSFYGILLVFARVKSIQVDLLSTTSAVSVLVGGAGSAWSTWVGAPSHQLRVRNGGTFFLGTLSSDAVSYLVTAGTGDMLKIGNEDGANVATVRLTITGKSS